MNDLTKEKRIHQELERISNFFEPLAENQRAIIKPLLQNAAFMLVTLEDLQEKINSEGVIEVYQNGANQHGLKQSAALQSYNSLIRNYASVIKTLGGMLPRERRKTAAEEYMEAMKARTLKTPEDLEAWREERYKEWMDTVNDN